MAKQVYQSMEMKTTVNRREFLKATGGVGSLLGFGLVLKHAPVWALSQTGQEAPEKVKTNIADVLSVPRTGTSLPGPFPGRVVEVQDAGAMVDEKPVPEVVNSMFAEGIARLTGRNLEGSFSLFFSTDDVVGIKVNPVGSGLISTRLEVVDAVIDWLVKGGIKKENIVIWDRMDYMLTDAGFTAERYPGIGIEGLQFIDPEAFMGEKKDNISSIDASGHHVSEDRFDMDTYYWADVEGPKDPVYLNQHVFNGKYSYFGKLLTQKLTKIINIPVFKNTASAISMATKNIGYGAICNTNRLHKPVFFNVNTEVHAFPVIRDKLVLNITDGLRAQCDGGPMPAAKFAYIYNRLYFATDPFALDLICHNQIIAKRKEMGIKTDEHPRWTEYLRYGERLGLGIANPEKIQHIKV